MAKRKKRWVYAPPKKPKPKVPDSLKAELIQKANEIIQNELKPYCSELDKGTKEKFNYIVDLYTTWWRNYFYFCSKYHSPGPNALSPFFDNKFARLEYVGEDSFNLSYMRHTGKWVEIHIDLSMDECLAVVKDDPLFHP